MSVEKASVFSTNNPRYFAIASGRPFLNDLAETLLHSALNGDFALSDMTIYLPTRRAARALTDAFLDASRGGALLLPSMKAIGDIDEDEIIRFDAEAADELDEPPAISSIERRLILARFIAEKDKTHFDGQRRWSAALAAADELGKLLDSLFTEEIPASRLRDIVPDSLAEHWQESLEFLSIITRAWPEYLEARGLSDPAKRRIDLIERQRARWEATPPANPIIIAGTTGSTPAVARFMKTVAALPMGCVVLPGLDLNADDSVWDAIDEPHPQSGLRDLLVNKLKITRDDVTPWPSEETDAADVRIARVNFLTIALRPAEASDSWREWVETARADKKNVGEALNGFSLIEAEAEEDEAAAIALVLRENLEHAAAKAIFITPDRDISRRVAAIMRRWGVTVDDSAGTPFANTPCGTYLRLVARWMDDVSDPVALLAMIDHPLFEGGLTAIERRAAFQDFDHRLRGLRPLQGLAGLEAKLTERGPVNDASNRLLHVIKDCAALISTENYSFGSRLATHLTIAETFSASDACDGAKRLWSGEDGAFGAQLIANLRSEVDQITGSNVSEYAAIFDRLVSGGAVRMHRGAHPRISILGPLEARLQSADLIVLAGLNEGVWPRDAAIDPFLSRPMRKNLGLPSPERRIGLSAHDFAQFAAAPRVVLTRAKRQGGKPAKPSRWIVRIKNILNGAGAIEDFDQSARYRALIENLDKPQTMRCAPAPHPRPPVEARPTSLYVTQVEKLMRDPYAVYARHILRLRKLDPHDDAFGMRDVGNLFHAALEAFAATPNEQSADAFLKILKEKAPHVGFNTERLAFWAPHFSAAAQYIEAWSKDRAANGSPCVIEGEGARALDIDGETFTLRARADRIDLDKDGSAFVIDYKTGAPPTLKQTQKFSPQLPLTGLIVREGGFVEMGARRINGLEYVRVLNRKTGEASQPVPGDACDALIEQAFEGVVSLIRHFRDPASAYFSQPRAEYANQFGDYDHLARRRERGAVGDGE